VAPSVKAYLARVALEAEALPSTASPALVSAGLRPRRAARSPAPAPRANPFLHHALARALTRAARSPAPRGRASERGRRGRARQSLKWPKRRAHGGRRAPRAGQAAVPQGAEPARAPPPAMPPPPFPGARQQLLSARRAEHAPPAAVMLSRSLSLTRARARTHTHTHTHTHTQRAAPAQVGPFLDALHRICAAHVARGDFTAALVAAERAAATAHPYAPRPRAQASRTARAAPALCSAREPPMAQRVSAQGLLPPSFASRAALAALPEARPTQRAAYAPRVAPRDHGRGRAGSRPALCSRLTCSRSWGARRRPAIPTGPALPSPTNARTFLRVSPDLTRWVLPWRAHRRACWSCASLIPPGRGASALDSHWPPAGSR
jgi:hypothetical protein